MKKYLLPVIIFCFISIGCSTEKKRIQKSELSAETDNFMKQYLAEFDSIPNVKESSKDTYIFNCLTISDMMFSKEEIRYLEQEIGNDYKKKWSQKKLPRVKIITDKTFRKKGRGEFNTQDEGTLFVLTQPVFIRNGKYCIIYEEIICGSTCGQGSLILFQKEETHWKEIKRLCNWDI